MPETESEIVCERSGYFTAELILAKAVCYLNWQVLLPRIFIKQL